LIPRIAVAISILVLAALFMLPVTRVEVRRQFNAVFDRESYGPTLREVFQPSYQAILSAKFAKRAKIASRYPTDYRLQLAEALGRGWHDNATDPVERCAACVLLTNRFPANPSTYAFALREEMSTSLLGSRYFKGDKTYVPPRASLLALMSSQASTAQQIDPGNAFFPTVQMAVRLAQHRDSEALSELRDAAACTHWNSYEADVIAGRERLDLLVSGDNSTYQHLMTVQTSSEPELSDIREAAGIAAQLAAQREALGDKAGGAAIRLEVMRIGSLLRTSGGPIMCSIMGMSVESMAARDPDSAQMGRPPFSLGEKRERLANMLKLNGFAADMRAVSSEWATLDGIRSMLHGDVIGKASTGAFIRLAEILQAGVLIWNNILALAALGAGIWLFARLRSRGASQSRFVNSSLLAGFIIVTISAACAFGVVWNIQYNSLVQAVTAVYYPLLQRPVLSLFMRLAFDCLSVLAPLCAIMAVVVRLYRNLRILDSVAVVGLLTVLLYAGFQLATIAVDRPVWIAVSRMGTDEGAYYAQLKHASWPRSPFDPPIAPWKETSHPSKRT